MTLMMKYRGGIGCNGGT